MRTIQSHAQKPYLLSEKYRKLSFAVGEAKSVCAIHNPDHTIGALKIVLPVGPE
jgi:hypothetical protein